MCVTIKKLCLPKEKPPYARAVFTLSKKNIWWITSTKWGSDSHEKQYSKNKMVGTLLSPPLTV